MIFVTVGTHEQPFNRLIEAVDRLCGAGVINEPVVMQTGFSTYEPQHCEWHKLLPYPEMVKKSSRGTYRHHSWRSGKLHYAAAGWENSHRGSETAAVQ